MFELLTCIQVICIQA